MIWNENLHPPGGFVFTDADRVEHQGGSSVESLVSALVRYRSRRGIPLGNPWAEVHEQLCARFPDRCRPGAPPEPPAPGPGEVFGAAVTRWLRETWMALGNRAVTFASADEVKRRVAICAACPQQQALPINCASCGDALDRVSAQLRAGRDQESVKLKGCKALGVDCRVDVLLNGSPRPAVLPPECWKHYVIPILQINSPSSP